MGKSASWIVPYLAMSSTALTMTRGGGRVQPRRVGQNLSASMRTKQRRPSSSTSVAMTSLASLSQRRDDQPRQSNRIYADEPLRPVFIAVLTAGRINAWTPQVDNNTLTTTTALYAVVTTTIRLRFDCSSTTLRPFDDLRYDGRPTCCGLLHCGLNK